MSNKRGGAAVNMRGSGNATPIASPPVPRPTPASPQVNRDEQERIQREKREQEEQRRIQDELARAEEAARLRAQRAEQERQKRIDDEKKAVRSASLHRHSSPSIILLKIDFII